MDLKILSTSQCDSGTVEFTTFYDNDFKILRTVFQDFKEKEDRLDHFWFQQVKIYNYETLSFIVKLILTLCHGQASVERAFSVNNIVEENNMKEITIIAKKRVIDHMNANKLKPYTIEVDKDLLKAVRSARSKWELDR